MPMKKIIEKFGISAVTAVTEIKKGHTNITYCVESISKKYILQTLNRDIFKNPEIVMNNILFMEKVFDGEDRIIIPHYLRCDGKIFTEYDGDIWHMYEYIESMHDIPYAYEYGFAVGRFLRVVNVYSGGFEFGNPIKLHDFGLNLPLRNIHGDTKLDNIIFGEKPAVIDLDTAMRGYVCADYGDMVRSMMITRGFNLHSIRSMTNGFADGLNGMLTAEEINSLYDGIVLVTSELRERYHEGVKNFPNKTPEQCEESERKLSFLLEGLGTYKVEITRIISECFE